MTTENKGLARIDSQALLSQAVEKGASVETLERLVALSKEMRAAQAREAWYEAIAAFQRDCPPIRKSSSAKIATRSGGGYSYKFASLDEIMGTVVPVLSRLGLSVSWRSSVEAGKVTVTCRVAHSLGHVEDGGHVEMPVVTADAGSGANPAQRVGIALTYARRYALLNALGLAPEDDDDDGGSRDVRHGAQRARPTTTEPDGTVVDAVSGEIISEPAASVSEAVQGFLARVKAAADAPAVMAVMKEAAQAKLPSDDGKAVSSAGMARINEMKGKSS